MTASQTHVDTVPVMMEWLVTHAYVIQDIQGLTAKVRFMDCVRSLKENASHAFLKLS